MLEVIPLSVKDGDEYPFQATAQGVAFGAQRVNWDIRMVTSTRNRMVGTMLSTLYKVERFWYRDHFFVQVGP